MRLEWTYANPLMRLYSCLTTPPMEEMYSLNLVVLVSLQVAIKLGAFAYLSALAASFKVIYDVC